MLRELKLQYASEAAVCAQKLFRDLAREEQRRREGRCRGGGGRWTNRFDVSSSVRAYVEVINVVVRCVSLWVSLM